MISELTQDLINKIKTVAALQNRVGAAVGGTEADPTMANAPTPFVWVIYGGDVPAGEVGKSHREVSYQFRAMLTVQYGLGEADLLDVQLKTLEAIPEAVSGKDSIQYAGKWEYEGSELTTILADRLVYLLTFSVEGYHKLSSQ